MTLRFSRAARLLASAFLILAVLTHLEPARAAWRVVLPALPIGDSDSDCDAWDQKVEQMRQQVIDRHQACLDSAACQHKNWQLKPESAMCSCPICEDLHQEMQSYAQGEVAAARKAQLESCRASVRDKQRRKDAAERAEREAREQNQKQVDAQRARNEATKARNDKIYSDAMNSYAATQQGIRDMNARVAAITSSMRTSPPSDTRSIQDQPEPVRASEETASRGTWTARPDPLPGARQKGGDITAVIGGIFDEPNGTGTAGGAAGGQARSGGFTITPVTPQPLNSIVEYLPDGQVKVTPFDPSGGFPAQTIAPNSDSQNSETGSGAGKSRRSSGDSSESVSGSVPDSNLPSAGQGQPSTSGGMAGPNGGRNPSPGASVLHDCSIPVVFDRGGLVVRCRAYEFDAVYTYVEFEASNDSTGDAAIQFRVEGSTTGGGSFGRDLGVGRLNPGKKIVRVIALETASLPAQAQVVNGRLCDIERAQKNVPEGAYASVCANVPATNGDGFSVK